MIGRKSGGIRQVLTRREIEVLALCAAGLTDAGIAERLCISAFTVGNHVRRILEKTESVNRAQAVARAYELGLLGPDYVFRRDSPEALPALSLLPRPSDGHVAEVGRTTARLAELLREATENVDSWPRVLDEFAAVFNSHMPVLTWTQIDPAAGLSASFSPAVDPEMLHTYDEVYAAMNPLHSAITASPEEYFSVMDDFTPPPELLESRFYKEYCLPLGLERAVAWTIFPHRRWAGQLFLGKRASQPSVTPALREAGVVVFPAVRAALHSLWQQAESRMGLSSADDDHGDGGATLLVDDRGRFILGDEYAEAMLASGSPLFLSGSELMARPPADQRKLRSALAKVAGGAEARTSGPFRPIVIQIAGSRFQVTLERVRANHAGLTPIDRTGVVICVRHVQGRR